MQYIAVFPGTVNGISKTKICDIPHAFNAHLSCIVKVGLTIICILSKNKRSKEHFCLFSLCKVCIGDVQCMDFLTQ